MIDDVERDARSIAATHASAPHRDGQGYEHEGHEDHGGIDPVEVARVALVVIAAVAVWYRVWEPIGGASIIGIGATLVGGYPIFKEAFENIRERRMTMELSMTIALVAALSIGQAFTALVITAFVLVAEILEHLTVARGRAAIGDVLRFLPRNAIVRRNGAIVEIDANALAIGDTVLVNPGAFVPVDGTVSAGHSFVDEAHVTGEATPVEKTAGSHAYAGTVNQRGVLEITAEKLGRDTSFGRIIEAVEHAERSRAPIERLADRFSGYLVYFALGAAALTFLITRNIVATISVIIVAGACGIAAGTPLAVLGAVGRAARAGAIVKGGRYLEALAELDVVVFDKTGTLTYGAPNVRAIRRAINVTAETVLRAAAIAECRSEHPLASAIVARARDLGIEVDEPQAFTYTPGRGIRAAHDGTVLHVGNEAYFASEGIDGTVASQDGDVTSMHVARDGIYLGTIDVADTIRAEAAAAVSALRAMGIRTVLLSGDVTGVAAAVGRALCVDETVAERLPNEKSAFVGELVDAGKIVAMVGDGVNDEPALARATVGVAMGSGTDVARESADIVLLGSDLSRFVETVRIARRTKAIVVQNFAGTIAVDTIGIALAAFGLLNPLVAAFIHVTSELAFILNSTRMLAPRERATTSDTPALRP